MNEIKLKVNFGRRTCVKSGISLTTGDYNSTKIIFEFDREDGTKIFEMKNPDGDIIFVDEIINNEVVLVGQADVTTKHNDVTYIKYTDENDTVYWYDSELEKLYNSSFVEVQNVSIDNLTKVTENASLFTMAGRYVFEISLYDGDSKLTSKSDYLDIKEEQVIINDNMVSLYLPVFDRLIGEVDNLNIDVSKSGTTTTVELTKKDGTTKSVEILDGETGPQGEQGIQGEKGDNATINGVNTLNIVEGDSIEIVQNGSTLEISNTYEYDDTDIKEDISTNTSNISQNTADIATLNNNLVNYSLITETGSKLAITIDNSNYQMYITLKDKNDNVIHTSNTIDLPIEQLVMNVTYDNTNKAIVITLQNGTVTSVPVGALIDGLVSNDDLNTTLADYVQFNNFASKNNTGVIKAANGLDINSSNGNTYAEVKTYSQYSSLNNEYLISKGTLENVITGKDLTTKSYVDGLVGDIASTLDTIQGEVI